MTYPWGTSDPPKGYLTFWSVKHKRAYFRTLSGSILLYVPTTPTRQRRLALRLRACASSIPSRAFFIRSSSVFRRVCVYYDKGSVSTKDILPRLPYSEICIKIFQNIRQIISELQKLPSGHAVKSLQALCEQCDLARNMNLAGHK